MSKGGTEVNRRSEQEKRAGAKGISKGKWERKMCRADRFKDAGGKLLKMSEQKGWWRKQVLKFRAPQLISFHQPFNRDAPEKTSRWHRVDNLRLEPAASSLLPRRVRFWVSLGSRYPRRWSTRVGHRSSAPSSGVPGCCPPVGKRRWKMVVSDRTRWGARESKMELFGVFSLLLIS